MTRLPVGLDMIASRAIIPAAIISGIIADEAAIGMINNKTTAVRIIPVPGKKAGDEVEWEASGRRPIMPGDAFSSSFVARGGYGARAQSDELRGAMRVTKIAKAAGNPRRDVPRAKPELHFGNFRAADRRHPVGAVHDKRVNITTARLFKKAATPAAIVALGISGLGEK